MRRFAKRWAAVLFACCLLAACKAKEEDAQKYLQEGKSLLEKGNIEQARVQLQNALQISPKLTDGYYQLALIAEKNQDWKGLYGNLLEVVRLDPKHVQARLKLGQLYLAGREFDKASEQASAVLQLKQEDADAFALRAAILFAQGKKADSLREVGRALEKDPANLSAVGLQASIFSSEGRYAEALTVLDRGIGQYPKDTSLRLLKIRVDVQGKNFDAAVNDFQALISQYPDRKEYRYGLVELLVGSGRPEQAEAEVRAVVATYPQDVGAKLTLIDFLERRDATEAEKALKQFTEAQPAEIPLQSRLADFYASRQRFSEAQGVLHRIIELDKAGREGLSAKVKLARIALAQNDGKGAESLTDEVLAADAANSEALLLRSGFRLARNEPDAAIADLQIIIRDHPEADNALVMLGQAYGRKGAPELAESHFRKALEVNPGNLAAALPIAGKMIQGKELGRAEDVVSNALKANPANPGALQLLAQIRIVRKDWAGAQAAAAEIEKLPNGAAVAHFLRGVTFASQGNSSEAIQHYQQALQEVPDYPEALRALAQAYAAKGNRAGLKVYLNAFIGKNPKVTEAHRALGLLYAEEKQWGDAVRVLQEALKADPKAAATYATLAEVYLVQNKPNDAIAAYRQGMAELPDNIALRMALAEHYERAREAESAIAVYEELIDKDPTYDPAANNLASLLADYRTDKPSLERAARLAERFSASPNPLLLDTYGWAALRAGNTAKAMAALRQVVAAAPEVALFRYHLGMAYDQAADKIAARKELERALALAEKKGAFTGLERARERVKELSATPTVAK